MPQTMQESQYAIVLYDEYCNLCSAVVLFILRHDKEETFRFIGLRSPLRKKKFPLSVNDTPYKSVILVEGEKKYFRSQAVLRIFKTLPFPVKLLYVLIIIPSFIRDPLYNLVARYRFQWFGKRKEPFTPPAKWRWRFPEYELQEEERQQ